MEGQIALDGIKSTKDPGVLAIEGNDIEIIATVAGAIAKSEETIHPII